MLFRIGFQVCQGIDSQFLVHHDYVPRVQPYDGSKGEIIKPEIRSLAGLVHYKARMVEQQDTAILLAVLDFPGSGGAPVAFDIGNHNVGSQFLAQLLGQQPGIEVRIPACTVRNHHFHVLGPLGLGPGTPLVLGSAAAGDGHQKSCCQP